MATSDDLVTWKRYAGNPIIRNHPDGFDALLAATAKVLWDRDHWVLFYCAVGEKGRGIGLLTHKKIVK